MEIDILDFVEECRHLAKQALGKHAGSPPAAGTPAGSMSLFTVSGLKEVTASEKPKTGWST